MEGSTGGVRIVSRRMVQPESASSAAGVPSEPEIMHLTPWDLQYISVHYIQKGVLLPKPQTGGAHVVDDLASSFARALGRFYPLAGRLAVAGINDGLVVSLCCDNRGAEFVHAVAPEVTVRDIAAPLHIPSTVLWSFFPSNGMLCVCGDAIPDSHPVLAAQVTELADGIFVAQSLNHVVADGTTFWHFFNTWSEINRSDYSNCSTLSTPPLVFDRWFPDTCPVPITLPFSKLEDIIRRIEFPPVHECFFHFSADSVKRLKVKVNTETIGTVTATISSLQALFAHLWQAMCRARALEPHRDTTFLLPLGCRGRVNGVPENYMGSAVALGVAKCTVRHVLDKGLGWTAWQLNQAVASFDEARTRDMFTTWSQKPNFLYPEASRDHTDMVMACSPRFDVYGNDFWWGRPVTVRRGAGRVPWAAGRSGGGSMALEVCQSPEALGRLVADKEFMEAVSTASEGVVIGE